MWLLGKPQPGWAQGALAREQKRLRAGETVVLDAGAGLVLGQYTYESLHYTDYSLNTAENIFSSGYKRLGMQWNVIQPKKE